MDRYDVISEELNDVLDRLTTLFNTAESFNFQGESYVQFIRDSHNLKLWITETQYLKEPWQFSIFRETMYDLLMQAFQKRFSL